MLCQLWRCILRIQICNTEFGMAEFQLSRRSEAQVRPPRPPPPVNRNLEVTTIEEFTNLRDQAYHCIQTAQTHDDETNIAEAVKTYTEGLDILQKVLLVDCERLQGTEQEKSCSKQMQQKMTKAKIQVEYRLQSLQVSQGTYTDPNNFLPTLVDSLPSYEQAISTPSPVNNFVSLGDSTLSEEQNEDHIQVVSATVIYSIDDGVQIFFITPDGYVSAPSYPAFLKIYKFHEDAPQNPQRPPAFLQVGDWYYPLIPNTSPVLHTSYAAYLFPDYASSQQGAAVGLILPETVSASDRNLFEGMLGSLTIMNNEETTLLESDIDLPQQLIPLEIHSEPMIPTIPETEVQEKERTSTKISKGIIVAADWIYWGVGKGAEKAGELIKVGSEKLRSRMHPEESPRHIDPTVLKGMKYVREGADVAVNISAYVVGKLGKATMALAKQMAPHIRKGGENLLPQSAKSVESRSKIDSIVEVAASGLKGFGTVYIGLEKAAKALGRNLANETVQIVDHKYGQQAGQLADNTLYAAGNLAMTAYNVDSLGIKAVAKRAAKDTGKAVIQDIANSKKKGPNLMDKRMLTDDEKPLK